MPSLSRNVRLSLDFGIGRMAKPFDITPVTVNPASLRLGIFDMGDQRSPLFALLCFPLPGLKTGNMGERNG
jgi:hypothetical protein